MTLTRSAAIRPTTQTHRSCAENITMLHFKKTGRVACCLTKRPQADRRSTARSMNKAESTTHCGIGVVSELIRWEVVWDGQQAEGARRLLSPDALTASLPATTQTSGPIGPAPATEVKSERKRQLQRGWKGGDGVRKLDAGQLQVSGSEAGSVSSSTPTVLLY